jgi:1,4-alpha-glucan branching enzyme
VRPGEAEAVVAGTHGDPFAVLGVHLDVAAFTLDGAPLGELASVSPDGLFAGKVALTGPQPLRYHASNPGGDWWVDDPYAYGPVLGPMDDYYIAEGTHLRLFDKLGAHPLTHEGTDGIHFAVWAPNAKRVSVVGGFNQWDGRRHVMRHRRDTGIWEIFVPGIGTGEAYKFEILAADGTPLPLKADPFAFRAELRPATASITSPPLAHAWGDADHRAFWSKADARRHDPAWTS